MPRVPALADPPTPARAPLPLPAAPPAPAAVLGRLLAVPASLPCLAALGVFLWWAATEAGYPVTVWAPGGLVLIGMLAAAVAGLRGRVALIPGPVRLAIALLAAYTAWSYASIAWADAQGDAWDGANRTLVYLAVFTLFAAWGQRGHTAGILLGAWTLGLGVLALVTLVRLSGAADPLHFFIGARLAEPAGYPNAAAATWLMAAFPALVLAGRAQVPWWLRGLFAADVVVLADVALLSQSRGSLFALPILLVACFVLVGDRARGLAILAATGAAIAATAPRMLDVADRLTGGATPTAAVSGIAAPVLVAALAAGAAVALWGLLEARRPLGAAHAAALRRGVNALGVLAAVGVVAAALALTGNPVSTVRDGWHSFKRTYPAAEAGRSRLSRGLGSNRYDFYRVGLDTFRAHPILGVGADNFAQDYLARRHSAESPHYPHSLELRTLVQTGLVGAVLLFGALGAALLAAWRATRRADPLGSAVAGAATLAFLYWAVHGSADWLWEFAGLGAPAFAMLGLACALHPRAELEPADGRRLLRGRVAALAGVLVLIVALCTLLAPWGAERSVARAAKDWTADPARAFARLDRAARLNPLSDRPQLIAGTIALRLGETARADREFAAALGRNPRGAYAALERGAIASQRGDRAGAQRLLARSVALNPRDALTRSAALAVQRGERLDVAALNRRILAAARAVVQ